MSLNLTAKAPRLPVTIDELRAHARVPDDQIEEDALLFAYAHAATNWLDGRDGILNRSLITQTWELRLDRFPAGRQIEVPLPPLQSVTSITYLDGDEASQTLATTVYEADIYQVPARISLLESQSWPGTTSNLNAVTVTFVAGYGVDLSDVPHPLRLAILQLAAHWYENREPVVTGTIATKIPNHIEALVAPYIVR